MVKLLLGFTFVLVLIIGTGCQANRPPANEASPPPNVDREQRVEQITYTTQDEKRTKQESPQEIAERLVDLALRIPDVHDATAVVVGKYAVVGIDIKQTIDRSEVGTIKYTVAQALKDDPKGANAIVTADPDIVQRLREMAEDIRRGRPLAGIAEELSDIVSRIVPQLPRNVEKREEPQSETNQNRINHQNR